MPSLRFHRILVLLGLFAGFALRLFRLGAESLWYDETVSVYLAQKSIAAMLSHTAGDIHPPGYYFLLHLWQLVSQPTPAHGLEFLYAWPSLFFGILLLVLVYALGRRLLNPSIALLALWLTAINPFHLWYSQEVRMYTLGATLGLLCLWSLLKFSDRGNWPWLVVYALAAAAGLYTLYYFLFLIVVLNGLAFILLRHSPSISVKTNASINEKPDESALPIRNTNYELPKPDFVTRNSQLALLAWLFAQVATLLLFSPWLPIFYRQATEPPVPPWRVPWDTWSGVLQSISESLSALIVGQTPPFAIGWPWALAAVVVLILFVYTKIEHTAGRIGKLALILQILGPILIIYLVTALVTPLYHVRYLFTYAAPMMLVVAAAIYAVGQRVKLAGWLVGLLFVSGSFSGLYEFWYNPTYRADDHRQAVADLAANWRPGDVILVNAGWAYTPLVVYWPTELVGAKGSLPPKIAEIERLRDWEIGETLRPVVIRSGSVEGPPSLGWGDPESDFFTISVDDAFAGLGRLSEASTGFWHYRIYDTVNDPSGALRTWLGRLPQLVDRPYPGRDYLRVQYFSDPENVQFEEIKNTKVRFGDLLELTYFVKVIPSGTVPSIEAGLIQYIWLEWQTIAEMASVGSELSMSIRLYDKNGLLLSQQDESPILPTSKWKNESKTFQVVALPVPVSAKPGTYSLELIIYRQDSGEPLALAESPQTLFGQRLKLQQIEITSSTRIPKIRDTLARFDYIDLVSATLDRSQATAGEPINLELIWRPQANEYQDTYAAVIDLRAATGEIVQSWRGVLGGDDYPSGGWPSMIPVREVRSLALDVGLTSGSYTLTLHVERSSDGLAIPASGWWGLSTQPKLTIGTVEIKP